MTTQTQVGLVVVAVAAFLLATRFLLPAGFEKPQPRCREESLSTLEAWRMVAIPNYGPPPRNVVQVGDDLWACGDHEGRIRCYELEGCK